MQRNGRHRNLEVLGYVVIRAPDSEAFKALALTRSEDRFSVGLEGRFHAGNLKKIFRSCNQETVYGVNKPAEAQDCEDLVSLQTHLSVALAFPQKELMP